MSLASDIAGYLADSGIGTLGGNEDWSVYYGEQPAKPDNVVTVYQTGGAMGNPDARMYDPTIMVRVRARGHDDGNDKAEAVRDLLILPTARVIGDWLYTGFWLVSDVAKVGKDDNNRTEFTVNFRLMREPYTTA